MTLGSVTISLTFLYCVICWLFATSLVVSDFIAWRKIANGVHTNYIGRAVRLFSFGFTVCPIAMLLAAVIFLKTSYKILKG